MNGLMDITLFLFPGVKMHVGNLYVPEVVTWSYRKALSSNKADYLVFVVVQVISREL